MGTAAVAQAGRPRVGRRAPPHLPRWRLRKPKAIGIGKLESGQSAGPKFQFMREGSWERGERGRREGGETGGRGKQKKGKKAGEGTTMRVNVCRKSHRRLAQQGFTGDAARAGNVACAPARDRCQQNGQSWKNGSSDPPNIGRRASGRSGLGTCAKCSCQAMPSFGSVGTRANSLPPGVTSAVSPLRPATLPCRTGRRCHLEGKGR